jgi:hypothetical protein
VSHTVTARTRQVLLARLGPLTEPMRRPPTSEPARQPHESHQEIAASRDRKARARLATSRDRLGELGLVR